MAISVQALREAARDQTMYKAASRQDAELGNAKSVFLCHSHDDQELVRGLLKLFAKHGWMAYVDWRDATLPTTPNAETAARIKSRIAQLNYFFFLATERSVASRWCPWEIGIADGVKDPSKVVIIPTQVGVTTYGNEYLQLYRRLDLLAGELAVLRPNMPSVLTEGVRLRSL